MKEKHFEILLMIIALSLDGLLKLIERFRSESTVLTAAQLDELLEAARSRQIELDDRINAIVGGSDYQPQG